MESTNNHFPLNLWGKCKGISKNLEGTCKELHSHSNRFPGCTKLGNGTCDRQGTIHLFGMVFKEHFRILMDQELEVEIITVIKQGTTKGQTWLYPENTKNIITCSVWAGILRSIQEDDLILKNLE